MCLEEYLNRWYGPVVKHNVKYKVVKKFTKGTNVFFMQKDERYDDWRVLTFLKLNKVGRNYEAIL